MIPAAYAVVDLSALGRNLVQVRQCAPDARVMAVVKADGYGHGLVRVATALKGVDAFAVARVDEGVRLRDSGIRERIAVLEGFIQLDELELHRKYGLEPVIHSRAQIDMLETVVGGNPLRLWLKMDTGMHRLG